MKKYGRRAKRWERRIKGYVLWPLTDEKAFSTFSTTKIGVEDKLFIRTGKKSAQMGLKIIHAEINLRVFPNGRSIMGPIKHRDLKS